MKAICQSTIVKIFLLLVFFPSCQNAFVSGYNRTVDHPGPWQKQALSADDAALHKLIQGALDQTLVTDAYDPAYVKIDYPNGDVPLSTGVCSDVVIRAFRAAGVDLQKAVHEDMRKNFSAYPKNWGLSAPDKNIDHRRVPNLQTYFRRLGKALPITNDAKDYQPGDVVTWNLNGDTLPHTGIVTNYWSPATQRYVIVHNIGQGARMEDRLFDWTITGHYRYF